MRKSIFILLLSVLFLITNCQIHEVHIVNINNGIELKLINNNIRIQFYDENIVRVIKWPSESNPDKKSLSVIQNTNSQLNITISEENSKVY